jgi:hypothetical protein
MIFVDSIVIERQCCPHPAALRRVGAKLLSIVVMYYVVLVPQQRNGRPNEVVVRAKRSSIVLATPSLLVLLDALCDSLERNL